ncbi:hypothetical protein OAH05_00675 [bacterium]|nr:hypothetical protein [bacterium]
MQWSGRFREKWEKGVASLKSWQQVSVTSHQILENNVSNGVFRHVPEAWHFGATLYETLRIALQQKIWRCRVVLRMDWDQPSHLQTYFY